MSLALNGLNVKHGSVACNKLIEKVEMVSYRVKLKYMMSQCFEQIQLAATYITQNLCMSNTAPVCVLDIDCIEEVDQSSTTSPTGLQTPGP